MENSDLLTLAVDISAEIRLIIHLHVVNITNLARFQPVWSNSFFFADGNIRSGLFASLEHSSYRQGYLETGTCLYLLFGVYHVGLTCFQLDNTNVTASDARRKRSLFKYTIIKLQWNTVSWFHLHFLSFIEVGIFKIKTQPLQCLVV